MLLFTIFVEQGFSNDNDIMVSDTIVNLVIGWIFNFGGLLILGVFTGCLQEGKFPDKIIGLNP